MFLAIDIGNTSIKFGVFEGDRLVSKFAIPTKREYDAAALGEIVNGRLVERFTDSLISSVVPEVDAALAEFVSNAFGIEARFVRTSDDFGLTFKFPVDETGADRLINSSAAAEKYGVPCVVVAFGTATTIDVVDRNREYRGGLIAPGPATTAKAVQIAASKLPEVEIVEPPNLIGTTTVTAIQSGIFYSQIGLIDAAIPHIKAEIGDDAKVIATGGFARLIAERSKSIDVIDEELTLDGLRMLHKKERVPPARSEA